MDVLLPVRQSVWHLPWSTAAFISVQTMVMFTALMRPLDKLHWQFRAGPEEDWLIARGEMISRWPVRTGVLVDNGVAFFGAGVFPHENVYLYAVNANDGSVIWKQDNLSAEDAGRNDLSPQGYLLPVTNLLFVPSGRSLPAAFDRKTGKLIHKRTHGMAYRRWRSGRRHQCSAGRRTDLFWWRTSSAGDGRTDRGRRIRLVCRTADGGTSATMPMWQPAKWLPGLIARNMPSTVAYGINWRWKSTI